MSTASASVARTRTEEVVLHLEPNRVRPFADQPREYFDKDELISLELSIQQRGQLQPVMVRALPKNRDHDYELVDGQRRWHACSKLGVSLRAVVINPENEEDQFEISVASNFQRAGHTPMEIAKAISRMMDPERGNRTAEYVGTLFGKSDWWVYMNRRLLDLVPEIQSRLDPGSADYERDFPMAVALELARMPAEQQMPMLMEIETRKLTASRAVDKIRQAVRGETPERRGRASQHERNLELLMRSAIQRADMTMDRLDAESFRILVTSLVKTKKLDSLKELAMTAIGRLETIHRRLTDVGSSVRTELETAPKPSPKPTASSTAKRAAATIVYSIPMLCPKCHTKNARFRRRSDANVANDFWTCDIKGCQLKISHYSIKVDRNYQPMKGDAA